MKRTEEDFLEEIIIERIDQILQKNLERTKKFYEEQDSVLDTLDKNTRGKFEEFASNMLAISSKECVTVYKKAFLDGLLLGHKAF
ncbi:hypothetical protein [Lacrimispora sp.]|uniref:hypothetical protein n=1 Tax=Lacrimispora sp. TaxID=2719234 RepID=UPI0034604405